MGIEYFEDDDGEQDSACGDCGHPLENCELRAGRCRNCGHDLTEDDEEV